MLVRVLFSKQNTTRLLKWYFLKLGASKMWCSAVINSSSPFLIYIVDLPSDCKDPMLFSLLMISI